MRVGALDHFALNEGELHALRDQLVQHEVEMVEDARPRWGARGVGRR